MKGTNKYYLSEIIENNNVNFKSNNLIISPFGSGKTFYIQNKLINTSKGKTIALFADEFSKNNISNCLINAGFETKYIESKDEYRPFTHNIYGNDNFEIHIMTYYEFECQITINNDFVKDADLIYCDEIQSLMEQKSFMRARQHLCHSEHYLFFPKDNQKIFYFADLKSSITNYKNQNEELFSARFKNTDVFDYSTHPNIKGHTPLSQYEIKDLYEIEDHLKAKLTKFVNQDSKGLAVSATFSGLKYLEKIIKEEGYNPITIWSDEKCPMVWSDERLNPALNDEQIMVKKSIIQNKTIPKPYNFLIMDIKMREQIELQDNKINLLIANTTTDTDFIKIREIVTHHIDLLIRKKVSKPYSPLDVVVKIKDEFLNIPLDKKDKDNVCKDLNIVLKNKNKYIKWPTVKNIIAENGYIIKKDSIIIDGKSKVVHTISEQLHK